MSRGIRGLFIAFLGLVAIQHVGHAAHVVLRWQDNSSNEDGFRLERALAGVLWTRIAEVGANTTSYKDTTVLPNSFYSYRICAFNRFGQSAFSNIVTAKVAAVTQNTAPTISVIPDQEIFRGTSTGTLRFRISDAESAAGDLQVSVSSSDTTLIPSNGITLGGTGRTRTIAVRPRSDRTGTATITVRVSDGRLAATRSFRVGVHQPSTTAPVITHAPVDTRATAGQRMVLRVAASAPGTASEAISYQWFHNGVAITGATSAEYEVPSAQQTHAGTYHVRISSTGSSTVSDAVEVVVDTPASSGSRLLNLSTRAWCGTDEQILIPSVVVQGGAGPKRLLVRVVGPSLGQEPFGLSGVLSDPRLQVKCWNGTRYLDVTGNDNWGANASAVTKASADVFAFPLRADSRDAALVTEFAAGQYTLLADDVRAGSGLCLVEVYDLDEDDRNGVLVNLATRGVVSRGDDAMIMGLVVSDEGPLTLLLRAVGPGLARDPFNVSGVARDPVLEVYGKDSAGTARMLLSNDDWAEDPNFEFTRETAQQVKAFALDPESTDAALVATFPPGAYTVIIRGATASRGVVLAEAYVVR